MYRGKPEQLAPWGKDPEFLIRDVLLYCYPNMAVHLAQSAGALEVQRDKKLIDKWGKAVRMELRELTPSGSEAFLKSIGYRH